MTKKTWLCSPENYNRHGTVPSVPICFEISELKNCIRSPHEMKVDGQYLLVCVQVRHPGAGEPGAGGDPPVRRGKGEAGGEASPA